MIKFVDFLFWCLIGVMCVFGGPVSWVLAFILILMRVCSKSQYVKVERQRVLQSGEPGHVKEEGEVKTKFRLRNKTITVERVR